MELEQLFLNAQKDKDLNYLSLGVCDKGKYHVLVQEYDRTVCTGHTFHELEEVLQFFRELIPEVKEEDDADLL